MEECNLWSQVVHQFHKSCEDFDGLWMKRRRRFNTSSVVKSLLHLVGGAQKSYLQALDQFDDGQGSAPSASSFCEARSKLPSHLIGEIRQDTLETWDDLKPGELWHGYRIHAIDGTKTTLPTSLSEYGFRTPVGGYSPQALVSLLVRVDDRMVRDISISEHEDERMQAHEHLSSLGKGDLVIYDRGYLSFGLLCAHIQAGVEAVFRIPKGNVFRSIDQFWKGRSNDKIVTINPTSVTYRNTSRRHPEYDLKPVRLRLIKYRIEGKEYALASTTLDEKISREDLIGLYMKRWLAEETFKAFKQTLELEQFHSKSKNGVEQELQAIALFWNLTRMLSELSPVTFKKV